ncbi:MAG: adenosylmethionine--8-amino-7-oxononanoate transaminase [Flavobacteriales bacterium]|nr:adenosylmethionine--8-amino-7-oxononanoate transaminase [Flavobacteriales bacterium]
MKHMQEKDEKLILHPFSPYRSNKHNINITHGKGALLYDETGRAYIDAIGSWWVNLHGHAHPYINKHITEQMTRLEHVIFAGFTHAPAVNLAERLLNQLGSPYSQLFYSDNGSTAVEVALKMSIQYWANRGEKRHTFIALKNSYHGDTFGAMSVSERDVFTEAFHQHLFKVNYIDIPTEENIHSCETQLEEIIEKEAVAAFIFEPLVQGAGGMRLYASPLLDRLIDICQKHHVLTIADEVMTGFYRTGTMFAINQIRNKPDFIILSKGLTGGYFPLGVTAYPDFIAKSFQSTEPSHIFYHGHSFTANPLSCTAALASLDLLLLPETKECIQKIEAKHLLFLGSIKDHPRISNARQMGVILAFDVNIPHHGYFYNHPIKDILYDLMIKQGILMRPLGNVLYILPPYCIKEQELDQVYNAIIHTLSQI